MDSHTPAQDMGEDKKLASKSKVDLACLRPCHSALKPHLQWLNQPYIPGVSVLTNPSWKNQNPTMMGKGGYGVMEPIWFCGAALPSSLVDLLVTGDHEEEEEEEEEENEEGRVMTLTISVKVMVKDDQLLSYEAHERLRHGS